MGIGRPTSRRARHGLCGDRRSGRRGRHRVSSRRRGVRRPRRLARRIHERRRGTSDRSEARQPDVRASGRRAGRGDHGPAGAARSRQGRARSKGADQRRIGRRGNVRGANREGVRRRGYRRVQHTQSRAGPRARCGSRRRLHSRRFYAERCALRPDRRSRRQLFAARLRTRLEARWCARHRGQREPGPLDRRIPRDPQADRLRPVCESRGEILCRDAEQTGSRRACGVAAGGQVEAGDRPHL